MKSVNYHWHIRMAVSRSLAGARVEIMDGEIKTVIWLVAPHAGARIEIPLDGFAYSMIAVAPLAGVRIEIRYIRPSGYTA